MPIVPLGGVRIHSRAYFLFKYIATKNHQNNNISGDKIWPLLPHQFPPHPLAWFIPYSTVEL